jgi:hypothetical protein
MWPYIQVSKLEYGVRVCFMMMSSGKGPWLTEIVSMRILVWCNLMGRDHGIKKV